VECVPICRLSVRNPNLSVRFHFMQENPPLISSCLNYKNILCNAERRRFGVPLQPTSAHSTTCITPTVAYSQRTLFYMLGWTKIALLGFAFSTGPAPDDG
jgi:hypothetical protein